MEIHQGREPEQLEAGGGDARLRRTGDGAETALKRAAVELVAKHSASLKQTARRYSLCREDAEDAYQRGLEILLTKAPTSQPHELIPWTHTVVKHEALAIRRNRERLLGGVPATAEGQADDWMALIPAAGDGPDLRAERREQVARSREALKTLKPAELRALTLLAEGYSYAEIGRITKFSQTKVNRCIAEGRERFRKVLAHSEAGTRCEQLRPMLSAFCDGEASPADAAIVREHLRACAGCRAALRAYRAAPGAAAALAPALPLARSLLERAHEALSDFVSRLPGGGTTAPSAPMAAGGAPSAGVAAAAKALAVCAGAAGTAAACVAVGVAPSPVYLAPTQTKAPAIERSAVHVPEAKAEPQPSPEPKPAPDPSTPTPERQEVPPVEPVETAPISSDTATEAEPVEYTPPPETPPPPVESSSASSGSVAGEFGP